jgi:hypothetical protein
MLGALLVAFWACSEDSDSPTNTSTTTDGGAGGTGGSTSSGGATGGDGGAGGTAPCPPTDGEAAPPTVFWPKPVRAHPLIPFSYTFVAYDPEGGALCYELDGAPDEMTIAQDGTIAWQPTPADEAASPIAFSLRIVTEQGGEATIPVSLAVSTDGFLFVDPSGDDQADGSLSAPMATIDGAMALMSPDGDKTVVVRAGTYVTHWDFDGPGDPSSPLRGDYFTEEGPAEIVAYPGEAVTIEAATGGGFVAFQTSYVLFRDLLVDGPKSRGGAVSQGAHVVFQRVTVINADWENQANCTGFVFHGQESVCHRCIGRDNYDRGAGTGAEWNSSNFLNYPEGDDSSMWFIECQSSGSVVGYKVKHGGPGTVVVHQSLEEGSSYGFGGADDGLVVRWNTFVGNERAIFLGMTDPSASVGAGNYRVENNTVVAPTGVALMFQGGSYPGTDSVVRHNVFQMAVALGTGNNDPHLYRLWPYESTTTFDDLDSDENCFFAPNDDGGFRVGDSIMTGWTGYLALGKDGSSVWADPEFVSSGDYRLGASSGCRLTSGVVPGAWR